MPLPLAASQLAAFREAARDPLRLASTSSFRLMVGGRDYRALTKTCSYSGDGEGPAVVLEAVIAARLPATLEGEPCRLTHLYRGPGEEVLELPGFEGEVAHLEVRGAYTTLTAATGGYYSYLPVGDVGEDLEVSNDEPSDVLFRVLSGLPYAGFEIPRTPEPKMGRDGPHTFRWTSEVKEVVDAVETDGHLIAADWPTNTAYAYPDAPLSLDAAPEWTFEEGRDTRSGGVTVESAGEAGRRYASVVVWGEDAYGAHQPLTRPIAVDNGGMRVPQNAVLPLEYTEGDAAGDPLGEGTAYDYGYRRALVLGRGEVKVGVESIYAVPHLVRGDPVLVVDVERRADGSTKRSEYLVRLSEVGADVVGGGGTYAGVGELLRETETGAPQRARPPVDTIRRPPWGRFPDGRPYVDDSLPWVSYDPLTREVVVDVEGAALAGVSAYYDEATLALVLEGTWS